MFRKRLARQALMPFIAKLPPVLIGMEACGGAHYRSRRFREYSHEVKLMVPHFDLARVSVGQYARRVQQRCLSLLGAAQCRLKSSPARPDLQALNL